MTSRPLVAISAALLALILAAPANATAPSRDILIVHSYHQDFQWTDNIMAGMLDVLHEEAPTADLHVEYLDAKRLPSSIYTPLFDEVLKRKKSRFKPEVIIVSDDAAFDLMLSLREKHFPGVPLVFCGVNNLKGQRIAGHTAVTGVTEDFDIRGTVDVAMKLHPKARHMAVISDSTDTGAFNTQRFLAVEPEISDRIDIIKLFDLTTEELASRLKALPRDTFILNLSFFRDRSGQSYSTRESSRTVASLSGLPVYSCWDFYVVGDVVGGLVVSGRHQGEEAAVLAALILNGVRTDDIPIRRASPNVYMFDYPVMTRFGIRESALPKGSIVLNRPQTLFSQYGLWIIGIFCVGGIQAFLIVALLRHRERLKATNDALRKSEKLLFRAQTIALTGSWELDLPADSLTWSDEVYRIFGYDPQDFPATYEAFLAAVHPDDRAAVDEAYARSLRDGSEGYEIEHRVVRHNSGEVRHVRERCIHERDGAGTIVRSTGMVQDITERKAAEEALRESEERYRTLFETAPIGIFQTTPGGRFLLVNPEYARIAGYSDPAEMIEHITDIASQLYVRPEERNAYMEAIELNGQVTGYEMELRRRDGDTFWASMHTTKRIDANGDTFYAGFFTDITERKQVEGALKESETRFKALHNASFGGITIHDKGVILECNQGLSDITGFAYDELVGMDGLLLIAEQSREMVMSNILAGHEKPYEAVGVRKNGEEYPLRLEARNIPYKGTMVRVVEFRDITEDKRRETTLRESEEKFRSAFDSSPDSVNINRLSDGLYVDINQGFTSLTGYTWDDVRGKTSRDIDIWCDYRDRERLVAELEERGFCSNLQAEFRRKDQATTTALMSASVIMLNSEPHIISITRDISERIKTENALAEAHKKLTFHIENSPLAVIEWANGTHISMWSRQAEKIFGWKVEEALGKSWTDFDFVHPEDREMAGMHIARLFDGSDAYNTITNLNCRKDGSVIHCRWYNSPLRDAGGNMTSILSLVADVSQLKEYEQNLVEAKEMAEAASKAKSSFLANMIHEIRTPLNGLMGMLQLMQMTILDDEQSEFINLAIGSSRRLTRLLSDILDLSRIEAQLLIIRKEPMNLELAVNEVVELFRPAVQQAGVKIEAYVDPAIPADLLGDSVRVQQILTNLVGNSSKFTTQGSIKVEAHALATSALDRHPVLFTVGDTGPGIPDEMLDTIFLPFTQADSSTTRQHQGAGLGLSICKKLVELMDGRMAVSSEVGAGTTVHFSLTFCRDRHAADGGADDAPMHESARSLRILLVEDEPLNMLAARKMLEKDGHAVIAASDGRQAIESLGLNEVDVVLMDVQMPVMDGLETMQAIRSGAAGQSRAATPVIALTAHAMVGDREKFLKAGFDGYMAKPFTIKELNRLLVRA